MRQLAEWHRRYRFAWISEHLSAVRVQTEVTPDHHAGLALPLAWDRDLLDMLCERVARAQDILGTRLLLENGVVHTPVPGSDMSEEDFMNALVRRTGCGLLLDLHNLHVNAVNLGLDADRFINGLDLDAIGEIHVAGGNSLFGAYLDSHAGACPSEVFGLLERTAPRCRNLAGVTFEFHETYFPGLGDHGRARPAATDARRDLRLRGDIAMSIAEFQRAFADLIASPERCVALRDGRTDVLADYDMTLREKKRLETMVHHEAMSVNCSLYRVNRLIPVYSVLPHSCRLLGDRLMDELDAFWAASRHATLQYRWELWRFGLWLEERIATRRLPAGPVEDAIRLEMAIFDVQAAQRDGNSGSRRRVVLLRYDPDELLDPAIPAEDLQPLASGVTVLIDATGNQLSVRRIDDTLEGKVA